MYSLKLEDLNVSEPDKKVYKRVPKHIGVIPDGNRRWAVSNNLDKKDGYDYGVEPGVILYDILVASGVSEVTFYGFTKDNNKRPKEQTEAYIKACISAVNALSLKDANILVVGNTKSKVFPKELIKFTDERVCFGKGLINVNFLINYDWNWDLDFAISNKELKGTIKIEKKIASNQISKIDLIVRFGGRTRLSGFLPVQCVYSDFYVVDRLWPDFKKEDMYEALDWYQDCDVTLGG